MSVIQQYHDLTLPIFWFYIQKVILIHVENSGVNNKEYWVLVTNILLLTKNGIVINYSFKYAFNGATTSNKGFENFLINYFCPSLGLVSLKETDIVV